MCIQTDLNYFCQYCQYLKSVIRSSDIEGIEVILPNFEVILKLNQIADCCKCIKEMETMQEGSLCPLYSLAFLAG